MTPEQAFHKLLAAAVAIEPYVMALCPCDEATDFSEAVIEAQRASTEALMD